MGGPFSHPTPPRKGGSGGRQ